VRRSYILLWCHDRCRRKVEWWCHRQRGQKPFGLKSVYHEMEGTKNYSALVEYWDSNWELPLDTRMLEGTILDLKMIKDFMWYYIRYTNKSDKSCSLGLQRNTMKCVYQEHLVVKPWARLNWTSTNGAGWLCSRHHQDIIKEDIVLQWEVVIITLYVSPM
jgi:hypothetical protein